MKCNICTYSGLYNQAYIWKRDADLSDVSFMFSFLTGRSLLPHSNQNWCDPTSQSCFHFGMRDYSYIPITPAYNHRTRGLWWCFGFVAWTPVFGGFSIRGQWPGTRFWRNSVCVPQKNRCLMLLAKTRQSSQWPTSARLWRCYGSFRKRNHRCSEVSSSSTATLSF